MAATLYAAAGKRRRRHRVDRTNLHSSCAVLTPSRPAREFRRCQGGRQYEHILCPCMANTVIIIVHGRTVYRREHRTVTVFPRIFKLAHIILPSSGFSRA